MLFSLPSVDCLTPGVCYCVMRDPVMRESIVVAGGIIQAEAETSRDFRRYAVEEPLPWDYVRVLCGKFALAIWRDPTRPELNIPRELAGEGLLPRPGDRETSLREDAEAEQELAAELAAPDPFDREAVEADLATAARRLAHSLYVQ